MKTSEQMVNDLFDRRETYLTEQKQKRKAALRVAVPAAALCLAAAIGVGVWLGAGTSTVPAVTGTASESGTASQNGETQELLAGPYTIDTGDQPGVTIDPVDPLGTGIGTSAGNNGGDNGTYTADHTMVSWRNKTGVHHALAEALDAAKADEKITILCHPAIDYDFVHGGKTIAQHYKDTCDFRYRIERMQNLLKLGDDLAYGEALLTTGNADGSVWDKAFYEETVDFIGEDLLSKYIVDGAFLKAALERDLAAAEKSTAAEDAYKAALTAFYQKRASELAGATADPEHFGLIFEMTPAEFEAFDPGPEPNGWSYTLPAAPAGDDAPATEPAVITAD